MLHPVYTSLDSSKAWSPSEKSTRRSKKSLHFLSIACTMQNA